MTRDRRNKRIDPNRTIDVPVSPEFLTDIFTKGFQLPNGVYSYLECESGLPPGAKLIGASYDPDKNMLHLQFEHPDFERLGLDSIGAITYRTKQGSSNSLPLRVIRYQNQWWTVKLAQTYVWDPTQMRFLKKGAPEVLKLWKEG